MTESAAPPRKLLVLDLDETLIHATENGLERDADFLVGPYFVYRRHYGNLVCVSEFVSDEADTELRWLAEYLPTPAPVTNVRKIEKRGWRKAIEERAGRE